MASPEPSSITSAVFRDRGEWSSIAAPWERLRLREPRPELQHHPEWLSVELADAPADGRRGRVAALFRDGELFGVAPIVLRHWIWECRLAWRPVAKIPMRLAHVMGNSLLAPPDLDALETLVTAVGRAADPHDALLIEGVALGSPLWEALQRSPLLRRRYRVRLPAGTTPRHVAELSEGLDAYLSGFSGRTRSTLRYKVRRLAKACEGRLQVDRVSSPEELGVFLRQAERVSRQTWQARRLGRVVGVSGALAARLARAAEKGWLRSYLMRDGEDPIAFVVGFQSDGTYQYSQPGYDPKWARFSPGNVLLFRLIEDLFNHDTPRWLDFGHGDNDYKQLFGTRSHLEANVLMVRRSIKGTLACTADTVVSRVNGAGRWGVRRLGALPALRHSLRSGRRDESPPGPS